MTPAAAVLSGNYSSKAVLPPLNMASDANELPREGSVPSSKASEPGAQGITSSQSSHHSNPSVSSTSSTNTKDSHSSHGRSSLFHRDHHHHTHDSALGQMLAPALSIAGAHNPFSISALCEDGSRKKTHQYGKSDKSGHKDVVPDGGESVASEEVDSLRRRPRKRDRIRSAFGRSLSPWRFHSDVGEKRRSGGASWNLSKQSRDSLDVQREKGRDDEADVDGVADPESDGESIKSGIVPRNSAFGDFSEESDSEDEMEQGQSRVGRSKVLSGRDGRDAVNDKEEAEIEASDHDQDGGQQAKGEESDDYIDFDEETLDNTLYNAGCIDLHDAWLKDDRVHHTHENDATHELYGPDDYDAAWRGAGPTGHDEGDEGLRAPNVVIGQGQSISPSELVGEGMDILTIDDGPLKHATTLPSSTHTSSASQSQATSIRSDGKSTSSSAPTQSANDLSESKSITSSQRLTASRPIFEKNRCTITLVHGEYERYSKESKRPRRYIVASDGSEESSYAIEWTIGTVLRDGDEMLVVSMMETDTKLDASDPRHEDKVMRQEHQRIRQSMAVILARRAVAVLQRTRLAVRVSCQALHARNSRHMFIDMIDFFEPTMCVVGSRGLGSLKGVLLGSFSHYCVQKSPVPVMVARKRLKLPPLPKGKTDVVSNVRARHMRLDQAMIEKDANVAEDTPDKEAEKGAKDEVVKAKEEREASKEDAETAAADGEEADGHVVKRKGSYEQDVQKEKEKEEETAIKRDAQQATELQEKEKDAAAKKQAKRQKEAAEVEKKADDQSASRGRKKFSVGAQEDDDDDDEPRGRSRSRTSERS